MSDTFTLVLTPQQMQAHIQLLESTALVNLYATTVNQVQAQQKMAADAAAEDAPDPATTAPRRTAAVPQPVMAGTEDC